MMDKHTAPIKAILRFALPLGTTLVTGNPDTPISWAVMIRAQPPAFPEVYGGELALVSMDILRSYDSRITLAEVVQSLAEVGVKAVAVEGEIERIAVPIANQHELCLLLLPQGTNLTTTERAVNKLILNQSAQLSERAIEIQRQLARLAAENRDLNSLLQVIARATDQPVVVHDDAGVLMEQVYPSASKRSMSGRALLQSLPYGAFQKWLETQTSVMAGVIVPSPIGYTTVLKVEKRIAGYLSLVGKGEALDDFARLVLTYGADVCAIELAKTRAIASAVEQTRGDWVQMWLTGTPLDEGALLARAQQGGFDPHAPFVVVVFKMMTESGHPLPLESLISLVRDDMARRHANGAVGQYVDMIVALYPLDNVAHLPRLRGHLDELRLQLAARMPSGLVGAGVSRPCDGIVGLREGYREAKDALSIAQELGEKDKTTFYGDLKLFQLLLTLKDTSLPQLRRFHQETIAPLVEYDTRKQSDLIRTLEGFFAANGNLAKASLDLDVHRNTLVYRLERIAELTNMNLDDADNRLILHLALKIDRVLATVMR